MKQIEIHDGFALRNGEGLRLVEDVDGWDCDYAVMLILAPMPPEPSDQTEALALLASEKIDGKWRWLHLCSSTKNAIVEVMLDKQAITGQWYGMRLFERAPGKPQILCQTREPQP